MNLAKAIGRAIDELRLERGMTRSQLSERAGLDRTAAARVVGARNTPTVTSLSAYADALGVRLSAIFTLAERLMDEAEQEAAQ